MLAFILLFAWSCSDDPELPLPSISFPDYAGGVYGIKVGKPLEITPEIINAGNPFYVWKMEGKIVSTELTYTFLSKVTGDHYLTFQLSSDNGNVQEEIKIQVLEKTLPEISLPADEEGIITAYLGKDLEIKPQVKYGNEATYEWKVNGENAGSEETLLFNGSELSDYSLSLLVKNEDGESRANAIIRVLESPKLTIEFPVEVMSAPAGRPLCISPYIDHATTETTYAWEVDGVLQEGEKKTYFFFNPTPEQKKKSVIRADGSTEYIVKILATEAGEITSASVTVVIVDAEGTHRREPDASSSARATTVYEFLPAPGQFINEGYTARNMDDANAYALDRMKSGGHLSLGGFGGYVIVGFDHSIANVAGKKDIAIQGNSFAGSSEPGIVWVMQDENGDGLPNDTWYELKGSEYENKETKRNYAVTYFKPTSAKMNVMWRDNLGNSGFVDYLGQYHSQDYYYPAWVTTGSYTLRGTCLESRNTQEPGSGIWYNGEYEWGYADNYGKDMVPGDGTTALSGNHNYFDLDNAVYPDGTAVNLQYVDFVKVQVGVNGKSGWLGEISTEVFGFTDLHIVKR